MRTVELDADLAADTSDGLPEWVDVLCGDALAMLPGLGTFDLIFADALAGKWDGLDRTLCALRPRGVLVVDDMDLDRYTEPAHREAVSAVRTTLVTDARLITIELPVGGGIMVATRRS